MVQPSTSQEDFLALVEQHKGAIIKVCSIYTRRAAEKEDLFQEIIIQLWKAWPNFKGHSKFSTWLYRIALNTAISGLRKKKTDIILMSGENLPHFPDADDHKEKEEKLKALYEAIQKLPEIDRAIVLLYLEDKNYEEMEDILGISQGTLRVKMNRAKEKLKRTIQTMSYGA
jgi:RNA polymerase sigma-70 factor (ECF subfamily)